MSTRYEKQIERLVAYVKRLNQTVEERNQQLHYWQGYARKLREERQRLGSAMIGQVHHVLKEAASRYQEARLEIGRQRDYIDHSSQLAQRKDVVLQNQLQYALSRIDDLSLERKAMRQEMGEFKRRAWQAEDRLKDLEGGKDERVLELEAALESALTSNRQLAGDMAAFQEQLGIQEAQWQEMMRTNQALSSRLVQAETALEQAQSALAGTLANQTLSTAREVDDLRSLVVSLQRQTEALRAEIATHQEVVQNQERFVALLKQGEKPSIRPLRRQDSLPTQSPEAPDAGSLGS